MRSCILVLYIAVSMVPGHEVRLKADTTTDDSRSVRLQPDLVPDPLLSDAEAADRLQAADPDALYARREDLGTARRAAEVWAGRLQKDPRDFESAWKLARAQYWVGKHVPKEEGKAVLESGIAASRVAVALAPGRPEGHFWLAANMGGLAESFGLRQGLKYRGEIKDELLTVLTIDPAYQQGSADRALGRWYFRGTLKR